MVEGWWVKNVQILFFSKCFTWDTPERLVEKILMGRNGFQGSRVVLEQRRRYPSFAKVRIIKYIKKENSEEGGGEIKGERGYD